ncbi:abortive infection protein, partial [Enterobacter kobei]|uniref:abortive infection protein n=1 Tax=Enterobacter kobei TaxID=208224 RepID=UPI002A840E03
MKNITTIIWATLLLISPLSALSQLLVTITSVPDHPHGVFIGKATGSVHDPDPNPCWGRSDQCALAPYTISELWLPGGKEGYYSMGTEYVSRQKANQYRTIGEWWADVTNKNETAADYLPNESDTNPCMAIAAGNAKKMIQGTIISNCAKGIVQARTCKISPGQIGVNLEVDEGMEVSPRAIGGVTLKCTASADIRIETNSAEKIPLGGDSTSVAVLDWGAG